MTECPNGRHTNGRWVKGYCPNPNGRRGKKRKEPLDRSDIMIFRNTLIGVSTSGQREEMTREVALLNKMFESAVKDGKVSMQRFLYNEFKENSRRLAEARARYDSLQIEWIIDNPRFTDPDFEIPFAVRQEMEMLGALLHYCFPEEYPPPPALKEEGSDEE